jgi:hypothetical protein
MYLLPENSYNTQVTSSARGCNPCDSWFVAKMGSVKLPINAVITVKIKVVEYFLLEKTALKS